MKLFRQFAAAALAASLGGMAQAAPTAEEIAQLGKTLTPVGAEKAGNKDGSIPAWDGGICKPPAGYAPKNGKSGWPYVDPYAGEKPLFSIKSENLTQYADKLSDGTKELFKRYPETYRIDVYPTHRSACFPDWVYKNTVDRAGSPKLEAGGIGISGAQAQFPFPVPKNGYEVVWNALLNFYQVYEKGDYQQYFYDASGTRSIGNGSETDNDHLYWDNARSELPVETPYWHLINRQYNPSSDAGSATLFVRWARADLKDPMVWSYVPGQRRVRLAPEFKYDTVATAGGGVLLYDEINALDGKIDKFDFKLVGKKEMYIPYNSYQVSLAPLDGAALKHHLNPDVERWELHRVWVVEASLKPGQRHVEKKKIFYVDEDTWIISEYDGIDQQDKPFHHMDFSIVQEYEKPMPRGGFFRLFDFSKGAWLWHRTPGKDGTGYYTAPPYSANFFAPDSLAGSGVR